MKSAFVMFVFKMVHSHMQVNRKYSIAEMSGKICISEPILTESEEKDGGRGSPA